MPVRVCNFCRSSLSAAQTPPALSGAPTVAHCGPAPLTPQLPASPVRAEASVQERVDVAPALESPLRRAGASVSDALSRLRVHLFGGGEETNMCPGSTDEGPSHTASHSPRACASLTASPGTMAGPADQSVLRPHLTESSAETRRTSRGADDVCAAALEALEPSFRRHFDERIQSVLMAFGGEPRTAHEEVPAWAGVISHLGWEAARAAHRGLGVTDRHARHPLEFAQVRVVSASGHDKHEGVPDPLAGPGEEEGPGRGSKVMAAVILPHDLTHRRMPRRIVGPRVLCLMGGIEYHRTEARLASIETLIEQEEEHLRLMVSAILMCSPDIILVEKTVARAAQVMLLQHGVAVALGCSPQELERVAWMTGGKVAPSLEGLSQTFVGRCGRFYMTEDVVIGEHGHDTGREEGRVEQQRTLMVFDGCLADRGCTILLRSAGPSALPGRTLHDTLLYAVLLGACCWQHLLLLAFRVAAGLSATRTGVGVSSSREDDAPGLKTLKESSGKAEGATADVYSSRTFDGMIMDRDLGSTCWASPPPHDQRCTKATLQPEKVWYGQGNSTRGVTCVPNHEFSLAPWEHDDVPLHQVLGDILPPRADATVCGRCGDVVSSHKQVFIRGDVRLSLGVDRISGLPAVTGPSDAKSVWMWASALPSSQLPAGAAVARAGNSNCVRLPRELLSCSFAVFVSSFLDDPSLSIGGLSLRDGFNFFIGTGEGALSVEVTRVRQWSFALPPTNISGPLCRSAEDTLHADAAALLKTTAEVFDGLRQWIDGMPTIDYVDTSSNERLVRLAQQHQELSEGIARVLPGTLWSDGMESAHNVGMLAINQLRFRLADIARGWSSELSGHAIKEGLFHAERKADFASISTVAADRVSSRADREDSRPQSGAVGEPGPPGPEADQLAEIVLRADYVSAAGAASTRTGAVGTKRGVSSHHSRSRSGLPQDKASRKGMRTFITNSKAVLENKLSLLELTKRAAGPAGDKRGSETLVVLHGAAHTVSLPGIMPPATGGAAAGSVNVPVDSSDPASVIAHCLSSPSFRFLLSVAEDTAMADPGPVADATSGQSSPSSTSHVPEQTTGSEAALCETSGGLVGDGPSPMPFWNKWSTAKAQLMLRLPQVVHIRFVFDEEGTAGGHASLPMGRAFQVEAYFPLQFEAVRTLSFPGLAPQVAFIESLCRSMPWSSQGGKSGVAFAKTWDERLVVKSLGRAEKQSLLEFAPEYFKLLAEGTVDEEKTSVLARLYGMYTVTVRTPEHSYTTDVVVMENLMYGRAVSSLYDLKGTLRSRTKDSSGSRPDHGSPEVLWDENLLERVARAPLYVRRASWGHLQEALWRDTAFLQELDVMDYSLLVGVDEEKNEIVVGIIDYLRQYTWDKQLETWAKTAATVGATLGAAPSGQAPTVVSPRQYMRRFRGAMADYFTVLG